MTKLRNTSFAFITKLFLLRKHNLSDKIDNYCFSAICESVAVVDGPASYILEPVV